MKNITKAKAWAIKAHIPGHKVPCFLGVFYFVGTLNDCQDGMRTCLFRTRKQARYAIKGVKGPLGTYFFFIRAVKVLVTIREIE